MDSKTFTARVKTKEKRGVWTPPPTLQSSDCNVGGGGVDEVLTLRSELDRNIYFKIGLGFTEICVIS